MIEVAPETACILYLGAALIAVLVIWLIQHKQSKKKEILSFDTKHFVCEFCSTEYLDDPTKICTRCPACQSLNKK